MHEVKKGIILFLGNIQFGDQDMYLQAVELKQMAIHNMEVLGAGHEEVILGILYSWAVKFLPPATKREHMRWRNYT